MPVACRERDRRRQASDCRQDNIERQAIVYLQIGAIRQLIILPVTYNVIQITALLINEEEHAMSVLDGAALVVIFVIIILIAVVIVFLGSLPGKIAVKRSHPYPDAVNAASWIGLATGIFWPVAFIWAFLPVSLNRDKESASAASAGDDLAELRQRLEALEATSAKRQSSPVGDV